MSKANTHQTKSFKAQLIAGGLSALLVGGFVATANAATQGDRTEPSVMVLNQKVQEGHLFVEYAYLPRKGYAVVYGADKDGKPIREPLGHLSLDQGSHMKFKIKLDKEVPSGTKLWVSLYEDKDGKSGFDKQADASIWGEKLPAENQVTIQ